MLGLTRWGIEYQRVGDYYISMMTRLFLGTVEVGAALCLRQCSCYQVVDSELCLRWRSHCMEYLLGVMTGSTSWEYLVLGAGSWELDAEVVEIRSWELVRLHRNNPLLSDILNHFTL